MTEAKLLKCFYPDQWHELHSRDQKRCEDTTEEMQINNVMAADRISE
jgi:hypothetical protein